MPDPLSRLTDSERAVLRPGRPEWRPPMLATLIPQPFSDPDWVFERKLDGVRAIVVGDRGDVGMFSRNRNAMAATYPELAEAVARLGPERFVADGEVVAFDAAGRTSFGVLQQRIGLTRPADVRASPVAVFLYLFDVLQLGDTDLTQLPLRARKRLLKSAFTFRDPLRYVPHKARDGKALFATAAAEGWEGVIGKVAGSPYRVGRRSREWVKLKTLTEEVFAVGGFTEPGGSRIGFGALLLGQPGEDGSLRYVGKVGTGFSDRELTTLKARLTELERSESPFANPVSERSPHWTDPELLVRVGYGEWTRDGHVRHPRYLGLAEAGAVQASAKTDAGGPGAKDRPGAEPAAEPERALKLSNLDKILYPESGITKGQVIEHYRTVAGVMVPHLRGRPLSLRRYPDGIAGEDFFQKNVPAHFPEWVERVVINRRTKAGQRTQVVCNDPDTLVYLANLACLELHPWITRADDLEHPDRLIIDIDPPPGTDLQQIHNTATGLRGLFEHVGLTPFLQTSGGKGFYVLAPLDRSADYETVRSLAQRMAAFAARLVPNGLTAELAIERRKGRIFLDAYRNGFGATAIAPYSLRARPGAAVATPIEWDELPRTAPDTYNLANIEGRLARRRDPFADIDRYAASAGEAMERLSRLTGR